MSLIPNGVDLRTFRPIEHVDEASVPDGWPFDRAQHWVVGTVGRQEPIKNQMLLARAVVRLLQERPDAFPRLRVVMVGAGPLHADIQRVFDDAGESGRLWMPGVRSDIASILRHLDCFVLPSLAEGTSCTLQEAMATALPIIATRVGGNSSLLQDGRLGTELAGGLQTRSYPIQTKTPRAEQKPLALDGQYPSIATSGTRVGATQCQRHRSTHLHLLNRR